MEAGKRLSTATTIFLSNNELTGSVPSSICSKKPVLYSGLADLDVSNNKLSGMIPTTIRYCTSLEYLNFGFNYLTGNVPKGLEQAKGLQILKLNDNNLDGDPLYIISELPDLQVLILGNNNFGGGLSDMVGSLNIMILSLSSNHFNGSIPKEIFDLDQLRILDLSGNKFTGLISRKISNLTLLKSPYNSSYRISGDYDFDVGLQMASKWIIIQYEKLYRYYSGIDLSSNELEGEIPEEIGLLKGLSMLNLSHNRLSGEIPSSVGLMNGLESLDLSYNKLSGVIPPSLASMDFLGYLNLSHNNLSGRIPRGLHMDTLSGDGSAYANNSFLCGYFTKNACEGDQSSDTGNNDYENEDGLDHTRDKWYFFGVVALGFIIGFWGLFFGLLLKKEIWWFGYWRSVDKVAAKIVHFFLKD
ncbi:receptor-like protein EIX1 [Papaver somniferum]|uniref:receptor-like protein EIX1 n=1 Tax=Papaver somniferum TaxID=3469 RepID=UPI000E6F89F4|nr:receptor-like protein EIX1 [Papaver somniferum]